MENTDSFHKPLILIYQRADRMKTTITENLPNWLHGSQPCLTQRNYEPCCIGPPKTDEPWWRVLTRYGPLEEGMTNHFSIFALKTPWTVWKGKMIWHWKMNSQVSRCPICYGEEWKNKSRKNEEMEPKWKQHPVVDVMVTEVRCCKEQYRIGSWDVRSMNQGKSEVAK